MSRRLQRIRRIPAARLFPLLLLVAAFSAVMPGAVRAAEARSPITVSVEGEVLRPGSYTLPGNATLSSLILAAGGFTDNADLRAAALTRNAARASQEAELRSMAASVAAKAGPSDPVRKVADTVRDLLEAAHASGRIPVKVDYPRLLKNSPHDIALEEGDVLRVPAVTDVVAVIGAVRTPSDHLPFAPGQPYDEYLRKAGGYADDADRKQVFLLRADGSTALLSLGFIAWNAAASRWEVTALTGGPPAVAPGDTIVVPRSLPPGLPETFARQLPGLLMRATQIAGAPVILP
ncbi:MAG: SLBB domain-containing protein [Verrucomicrobiota bacterium]